MKFPIPNYKSEFGFTLIEVAIAITLLALMTTILYGAFYLGHRAVEKWQLHSEESERLRSVGDFLGGYIRSAYPYRLTPRDPAIFFSGEETHLTFVSALSLGMGSRGMAKVSLSWDAEGAGFLILEEEIPIRVESDGDGAGYRNSLVLRQGVSDLRVDYLDSKSKEERWVGEWDGEEKKALPRAVRINFRGDRGEEIYWVFPIMMSVLAP